MAVNKNAIYVKVYKLYSYSDNNTVDSFMEALSDKAVISKECSNELIIAASSDIISVSEIHNTAIKFFGQMMYNIDVIGVLGPFKKCR